MIIPKLHPLTGRSGKLNAFAFRLHYRVPGTNVDISDLKARRCSRSPIKSRRPRISMDHAVEFDVPIVTIAAFRNAKVLVEDLVEDQDHSSDLIFSVVSQQQMISF